jgi:uncharacterized membrane protein YccC
MIFVAQIQLLWCSILATGECMDSEFISLIVWLFGVIIGIAVLFAVFRLFQISSDVSAIRVILEKSSKEPQA